MSLSAFSGVRTYTHSYQDEHTSKTLSCTIAQSVSRDGQADHLYQGMYNGSSEAVSTMYILQKAPHRYEETGSASSRETTGKSRCPRPKRRLWQRCMDRIPYSTVCGSRLRAGGFSLAARRREVSRQNRSHLAASLLFAAAWDASFDRCLDDAQRCFRASADTSLPPPLHTSTRCSARPSRLSGAGCPRRRPALESTPRSALLAGSCWARGRGGALAAPVLGVRRQDV